MAKAGAKKAKKIAKSGIELKARQKARQKVKKAITASRERNRGVKPVSKRQLREIKRRDAIIEQYMPYAASIANRVCQSLSSSVDHEDVLCNARLGLLEAAKRFDGRADVDFRTFAYYRIKGAIYDGLRRSSWLPRTLYAKIKFEEAANEYLQNKSLQCKQMEEKKTKKGGQNDKVVTETVNSLASIYIISLDAGENNDVEDTDGLDVEHRIEFMQIRRHMRDAIGTLPEKEKQLIMMYYFQNRTLEEVGEHLKLSKSWTSRLHARALEILFKRMRNRSSESKSEGDESEE